MSRGMMQNHTLARAMSDMGLGRFRHMLTYKAAAYGCTVHVASRWFPSSKLCCHCGMLHESLTLAHRVFVCSDCGYTADRDVHAAMNLERYPGLQGNLNACGLLSAGQLANVTGETRQDEAGTTESTPLGTF